MKLSLCPPFGRGGDNNPFHRITLEFLSMNFCGNSLKFELRCYTYLQSISMHSQAATYHIFTSNGVSELYPGKITIRSDLLKQIFDFLDQITMTRQYPALEQVNQQARGIGNNITFWNRLRSICPKGVIYNGPILNQQGEQCTTSQMLDEAMLDTRNFWFVKPQDSLQEWEPIYGSTRLLRRGRVLSFPETDFLHTLLGTKDSAPGPDGIPYSAWRLFP